MEAGGTKNKVDEPCVHNKAFSAWALITAEKYYFLGEGQVIYDS